MFKKRRLPQQAPYIKSMSPPARPTSRSHWFMSNSFIAWRVTIFFKWILKLKFFLRQSKLRLTRVQVASLDLSLKILKTKNSRMGKGRGSAKTFFVCFRPGSPILSLRGRSLNFFLRLHRFFRKTMAKLINFVV